MREKCIENVSILNFYNNHRLSQLKLIIALNSKYDKVDYFHK